MALGTAVAGDPGNSAGETIALALTFDGNVNGLSSGFNSSIFKVGGSPVSATWSGSDGSNTRTLTYTISGGQSGQAAIDETALKAALITGITDAAGNAFAYSASIPNIDAGTPAPTIDLGSYGKLIAPVQVDGGQVFYYWDRNGGGTADGGDRMSHDALDVIFNKLQKVTMPMDDIPH